MKFPLSRVALAASLVVVLAVPATAGAKPGDDVRDHANSARKALHKAERAARNGNKNVLARQLEQNLSSTNKAVREARSASNGSPDEVADAVVPVTRLEDQNVEAYIEMVDEIGGSLQEKIAEALRRAMAIRGVGFDRLAELVESGALPPAAQRVIARVLANVYEDNDEEVEDVEDTIEEGVPDDVESTLGEVLDMAFQQAKDALDQLEGMLDVVPDSVRPIVEKVLGLVDTVLETVKGILSDLLGGLLGGGGDDGGLLGGLFGGGGGLGGLPGLGGGLLGFGGLFGK
jgi:hypothetical protein